MASPDSNPTDTAQEKAKILEDFRSQASELVALIHPIFQDPSNLDEDYTLSGSVNDRDYHIYDTENVQRKRVYVLNSAVREENNIIVMTMYWIYVQDVGNPEEKRRPTVRLDKVTLTHAQRVIISPQPEEKPLQHPFTDGDVNYIRCVVSAIRERFPDK